MKASITEAERLRIAELILEGQKHFAAVDDIERLIALTLGFSMTDDRDAIMDALSIPLTVDTLLHTLDIGVEEMS